MLESLLYRITDSARCRLIPRAPEQPYLERYFLGQWMGVTAYLHRFVAADADEEVHDHPWRAVALCLCGHYTEERLTGFAPGPGWTRRLREIRPGMVNVIGRGTFHRIVRARPETWTLFLHGRRAKGWGFLKRTGSGGARYIPVKPTAPANWWRSAPRGHDAGREPFRR